MALTFDRYVARVASAATVGNNGFQSEQERKLLKEAMVLFEDICAWWDNVLRRQRKHLHMKLDENAPARYGAHALGAGENGFLITVSVEFLHTLVSDSIRNIASLPQYDIRQSILSAIALIFFHEMAHVIFGHTEVSRPRPTDYRIDEASADFRSGMLFVSMILYCKPFATWFQFRKPDEISRYAQVGALVLHRYLHEHGATSICYHGVNNRFLSVCAGYMYMAAANRLSDPRRLKPITQALERAVQASYDSGWKHVLRRDLSDNWQLMTQTWPTYHTRADEYDKKSSIAGAIIHLLRNSDRSSNQAIEQVRRLFGKQSSISSISDAHASREAGSRIVIADKSARSELNPNTLDALLLIVEFGRRGDFTDEETNEAAEFITRIGRMRPTLLMAPSIGGFDEDARRLTDIPECAQHFRRLFKALRQLDPTGDEPAVLEQFESQSRVLLRIAMGYAPRNALDIRPVDDGELQRQFWTDLERVRERWR